MTEVAVNRDVIDDNGSASVSVCLDVKLKLFW